jgi:hypothetical protein
MYSPRWLPTFRRNIPSRLQGINGLLHPLSAFFRNIFPTTEIWMNLEWRNVLLRPHLLAYRGILCFPSISSSPLTSHMWGYISWARRERYWDRNSVTYNSFKNMSLLVVTGIFFYCWCEYDILRLCEFLAVLIIKIAVFWWKYCPVW